MAGAGFCNDGTGSMREISFQNPASRKELTSLPGVGEYVAGAVLSIAYGRNEWLVDSNIVRIFKRYFGVNTSKEGRRDKHIIEIAKIYASGIDPGRATMGILDITALICRPGKPLCVNCPLIAGCHYLLSQKKNGVVRRMNMAEYKKISHPAAFG